MKFKDIRKKTGKKGYLRQAGSFIPLQYKLYITMQNLMYIQYYVSL